MLIATAVVKPCMVKVDTKAPIRVLNLSPDGVTIYKGTRIAEASLLKENNTLLISKVHNSNSTDRPEDVPVNK